jgi:hypothetical protein
MIYKVDDNEEFKKIFKTEKNKIDIMESRKEYVTSEELNNYSIFLKKKMDELESQIREAKSTQNLVESSDSYTQKLEERVDRLEKYCEYLAENLENSIKYGEYVAENLDNSITYSKYLAENLDKNISYSKYLAENVDKSILYSEYVAENVDKGISYSKYLAEKLDDSIQYAEYLAENVDHTISYSEYLAENVDRNISYSEYLAEKLDRNISYAEYLAENLDKGIAYSEYLGENLDKGIAYSEYLGEKLEQGISYSEYLAENVNRTISYSEYIAEKLNGTISYTESLSESVGYQPVVQNNARRQAEVASRTELAESGFAGDYTNLGKQIDFLIESVQTQKTETNQKQAASRWQPTADTQKADQVLNENNEAKFKTGHKFIDEMPTDYVPIWESLSEGHKQSIIAQAALRNLNTPYQIRNFWSTRQFGPKPLALQKLQENENFSEASNTQTPTPYNNDYLSWVAKSLEGKF